MYLSARCFGVALRLGKKKDMCLEEIELRV